MNANKAFRIAALTGSLVADTAYVLVAMSDIEPKDVCNIWYDAGDTDQGHLDSPGEYTFRETAVFSHDNYKYSIYCTYMPAAPPVAPTVTTQAVTGIGATTATGNGNVTDNGGENPYDRQIEWGTSSGDYSGGSCSAGGGGEGPFSCGLTGLPSGTTIYCRAKAHNSAG
ncbi:hypothetical protein ES703_112362 [subsurface metagenome]